MPAKTEISAKRVLLRAFCLILDKVPTLALARIVRRLRPPATTGCILNPKRSITIMSTPPPMPTRFPIMPTNNAVAKSTSISYRKSMVSVIIQSQSFYRF